MPCFLLGYTWMLVLLPQLIICQNERQYTFRVTNFVNCNVTGLKFFVEDVSSYYRFPRTYINSRFRVTEVLKSLKEIHMHIERCNDRGYECEDFQSWKLDHLCKVMNWRNQIWSDFTEHSKPPLRCPLKKTIYEVRNSTADLNPVMNWYPDMFKYHWKIHGKIMNEHNDIVLCSVVEARVDQVRVHNRRTSEKRGNT